MARQLKLPLAKIKAKVESLHEFNPMLGHRGCRLGITMPELYKMQAQAIVPPQQMPQQPVVYGGGGVAAAFGVASATCDLRRSRVNGDCLLYTSPSPRD